MAEEISPLEDHGWWMEQLRKDAKANRPEALRLADILQHRLPSVECLERAATELRRLHGENERLRTEKARWETAVRDCVSMSNGRETEWGDRAEWAFGFLYAAIAKAEEV